MKRWRIFFGRGGTVLITIGLALLLVSLLPPAQIAFFPGMTPIPPKQVQRARTPVESYIETILTPQQGLQMEIWANGTLNVYILEVNSQILYQRVSGDFSNVTELEEFLEANPSVIGWYDEIRNGMIEHEYVPTKVTNATLVFSNPSSEYVQASYDVRLMSRLAGIHVRNLGQWAIPIGVVIFLPWLTQMWKKKQYGR